jgi:hypothetical protein
MIKNYARNLVLETFDKLVGQFSSEASTFLRIYIYRNARVLSRINPDDIIDNNTPSDTLKIIIPRFIDMIRKHIMSFD